MFVANMSAEGISPALQVGASEIETRPQHLHGQTGAHGHDSPHIGNIEKCKELKPWSTLELCNYSYQFC